MNTGMNITKKAEIFASHLVEVAPHIGRIKPSLLLPKEILEKRRLGRKKGISDTEKEFVAQNISASKLMLMPDEETELLKIEYKARHIYLLSFDVVLDTLATFSPALQGFPG